LTTVVSTKGQVILPKVIRDQLHWAAGTRLSVEHTSDGVLLKATPIFAPTTIDALFGSMRHEGPALSIDDMDAAIAQEAKRRARD
jgi:AbrB family looped-hinge helix DNA binding protein